jgi:GNAT superfamily N-acetyltransferase
MHVRLATSADVPDIVRIFYETIHHVNVSDYTPEQIHAWAPELPDTALWEQRLDTRMTFVADAGGAVLAFGELHRSGLIDCLYCHHEHQRCGIGSFILRVMTLTAISLGQSRLSTASSVTARPFFKAHGFIAVKSQTVIWHNIALPNFIMEKTVSVKRP